jgi:pimeloyl-ACP methyl ester carboxylesterase
MPDSTAQRTAAGTAYQCYGPDSAPAVLMIHGLGLARDTWDSHIAAYTDAYRVITYDLHWHGDSSSPPTVPSLTQFSEQILELLDTLAIDQAALVGFSLGGMINRRFALDYPERVSTLAILNSPHERGDAAQKLVEERAAQSEAGGPGANLDTTIERWLTREFIEQHPDSIAAIRQRVLSNNAKTYAQCRMVLAAGVTELIRPAVPVNKPTLVMTCEHDSGSTPAMSHAIASEIPGAQTIIVPTLQHLGLIEQPSLFTDPIRSFLDQQLG